MADSSAGRGADNTAPRDDVPGAFRPALTSYLNPGESVRCALVTPSAQASRGSATLLVVTDGRWLVLSLEPLGDIELETASFASTFYVAWHGGPSAVQLRLAHGSLGMAGASTTIPFETMRAPAYRVAVDLVLEGIGGPSSSQAHDGTAREGVTLGSEWPSAVRQALHEAWPGQAPVLDAVWWPAVVTTRGNEFAPGGALVLTDRDLVHVAGDTGERSRAGGRLWSAPRLVVTYVPRVRLAGLRWSRHGGCAHARLALQARRASDMLLVAMPRDQEARTRPLLERALG